MRPMKRYKSAPQTTKAMVTAEICAAGVRTICDRPLSRKLMQISGKDRFPRPSNSVTMSPTQPYRAVGVRGDTPEPGSGYLRSKAPGDACADGNRPIVG